MNFEVMITDSEIKRYFEHSNFGDRNHRELLEKAILEIACGFRTGYTLSCIMVNLGLLTKKSKNINRRGKYYLWTVYSKRQAV